jgi:hypothetical protein
VLLNVYTPLVLGPISMLACIIALSFNKPPPWLAGFVWPGIVSLLYLFCSTLFGIVRGQSEAAKRAAWHVLNEEVRRAAPIKQPEKYVEAEAERAARKAALQRFLAQHHP